MSDPVTDAVVDAARQVPPQHLLAGAAAVADAAGWTTTAQARLIDASPAMHYRQHADRIARAWSNDPTLPGAALSTALRAAASTVRVIRSEQSVSLVWTGPQTPALGLRATRSVLQTLVTHATTTLVLVSFASYNVADLARELTEAADRGVDVSLILETPDNPGGPLTLNPPHPFAALRGTANFYRWPAETRKVAFAAEARLHAKCVIADAASALITSANLTSAGINDNIELGVLIDGGALPHTLHEHFAHLIDSEQLQPVH